MTGSRDQARAQVPRPNGPAGVTLVCVCGGGGPGPGQIKVDLVRGVGGQGCQGGWGARG